MLLTSWCLLNSYLLRSSAVLQPSIVNPSMRSCAPGFNSEFVPDRQRLNYFDADLRTVRRRDRSVLLEHHFPTGTRPSSRYLRLRSNSQPRISPSPSRLISTIRPPMQ